MATDDVPGRAMWDEWFDGQYDLNLCIDKVVKSRGEGKPEAFKAALYSGVIEHCAEQMRASIDLAFSPAPPAEAIPDRVADAILGLVEHDRAMRTPPAGGEDRG